MTPRKKRKRTRKIKRYEYDKKTRNIENDVKEKQRTVYILGDSMVKKLFTKKTRH